MIFAIDSGGTKTKILLAESNGDIIDTRVVKGFGIANDPMDEPLPLLNDTLLEMAKDYEITHVTVNLGGKNTEQVKNCIRQIYPAADVRVFRESSGVIGDYIRERVGADIIFFSGTGSITLAKGEKGCFVLDGWGRDIGDFGSGYYIGLTAIQQSLAELEGQDTLSLLAKVITGEAEPFSLADNYDVIMKKRDGIRSKIMPIERAKVAAISKIVYSCAANGDAAALHVFEIVGEKLGETAIRAIKQIQKNGPVTIAFCGGVSETKRFWLEVFEKKLSDTAIESNVIFPTTDFALGALEYTIKEREIR